MINYEIDPALLSSRAPRGTELDSWRGKSFLSVVGFQFLKTRVLGVPVPFHRSFEEVNLRFYVRRTVNMDARRGVVFIKEIVPRLAIATVARVVYNENYVAMGMRHRLETHSGAFRENGSVEYGWRSGAGWNILRMKTAGEPEAPAGGSQEEFITEHHWGYAKQRDGGTVEYRVEHPSWRVWQVSEVSLECDVARVYGNEFVDCLTSTPSSAFLAEGSAVTVRRGVRI